jgi:hypothetical protein
MSEPEDFCCRRHQQLYNIGCESGDEVDYDLQLPRRCFWCWFDDQFKPHRGLLYLPLRMWRRAGRRVRWYVSPRYRAQRRKDWAALKAALDSEPNTPLRSGRRRGLQ